MKKTLFLCVLLTAFHAGAAIKCPLRLTERDLVTLREGQDINGYVLYANPRGLGTVDLKEADARGCVYDNKGFRTGIGARSEVRVVLVPKDVGHGSLEESTLRMAILSLGRYKNALESNGMDPSFPAIKPHLEAMGIHLDSKGLTLANWGAQEEKVKKQVKDQLMQGAGSHTDAFEALKNILIPERK